jgi:hypothetical protein
MIFYKPIISGSVMPVVDPLALSLSSNQQGKILLSESPNVLQVKTRVLTLFENSSVVELLRPKPNSMASIYT